MKRTTGLLLLAVAVAAFAGPAGRADDEDDPVKFGKKASQWMEILANTEKSPPKFRMAAIIALSKYEKLPGGTVSAISTALSKDPEVEVRRTAAGALRNLGEQASNALESLAYALRNDADDAVRQACAAAIGRLGDESKHAVGPLGEALKDKSPGTRAAAAEALGVIGVDAYDAGPALLQALKDPDPATRVQVVQTLGLIKYSSDTTIPALADTLVKDDAPEVRERSADVLAQAFGAKAVIVLPALIQAVKGREADPKNPKAREQDLPVRRKAAVALSKLKAEALPALPTLREIVRKETDVLLVANAIHAIGAMGPEAKEAVPDLLARCPIEVNVEIRLAAISELGRLGPEAKEALPRLREVLKEGRADLRNAADAAIKQIEATPAPAPAP